MARLLLAGVAVGALTLFAAVVLLLRRSGRAFGIVIGAAGMAAGALAALGYTLLHFSRGVDIDAIPESWAAVWFVAGFGIAGGLFGLAIALLPRLRRRIRRAWPPGR